LLAQGKQSNAGNEEVLRMSKLPALFRRNRRKTTVTTGWRDLSDTPAGASAPHNAQIHGNAVTLYLPVVCLDAQGRTAPGVTKEMVASYLAATAARITDVQLGPVNVEWLEAQGRFVLAGYQVPAFDVAFEVVHPAGVVDQYVATTPDTYMAGLCFKVQEMMKSHQNYAKANALIRRSYRLLETLRDVALLVLTTPEYIFLDTQISKALVQLGVSMLPVLFFAAQLPKCFARRFQTGELLPPQSTRPLCTATSPRRRARAGGWPERSGGLNRPHSGHRYQ
jgi:hypothetical protein